MIEIKNCVMDYDGKHAVDGVSITVPEGCSYGLLGSNGAGKSTLMKAISGIYKPFSGSIEIDGEPVYDNGKIKERLFFIDDETAQYANMSLDRMKKYYKRFYPDFSDEIFGKLAATVGLPTDKPTHTFSKGMKRQAAVICGISCGTKYLLIDEAFDGLDPTMRVIVKNMLIDAMLDRKLSVIFSSHNINEIDEFCDRVGLLHGGKLVFDRDLENVKGDIVKIQASFDRKVTKEDFPDIEILHMESTGSLTYIIAKGGSDRVRAAVEKLSPKLCDEIRLTLNEIFIYEMEGVGYDCTGLNGLTDDAEAQ